MKGVKKRKFRVTTFHFHSGHPNREHEDDHRDEDEDNRDDEERDESEEAPARALEEPQKEPLDESKIWHKHNSADRTSISHVSRHDHTGHRHTTHKDMAYPPKLSKEAPKPKLSKEPPKTRKHNQGEHKTGPGSPFKDSFKAEPTVGNAMVGGPTPSAADPNAPPDHSVPHQHGRSKKLTGDFQSVAQKKDQAEDHANEEADQAEQKHESEEPDHDKKRSTKTMSA